MGINPTPGLVTVLNIMLIINGDDDDDDDDNDDDDTSNASAAVNLSSVRVVIVVYGDVSTGAPGASSASDSAQPWGADARLLGDAAALVFPSAGIAFSPNVASTCRAEYILGRRSEQDLGGGDLMYV